MSIIDIEYKNIVNFVWWIIDEYILLKKILNMIVKVYL